MLRLVFSTAICVGMACSLPAGADSARLKSYVDLTAKTAQKVPVERRRLLDPIARSIATQIKKNGKTAVVFVCTHNSRRSQFSQVWAQAAAGYYGLKHVRFASGGTETTAANIRTIQALRRAGWTISIAAAGDNPVYEISRDGKDVECRLFSKVYFDKRNPRGDFVAVMCCNNADENCPVVKGAAERFSLHFIDPKVSDGTPRENATYDERCRQIAAEMFYLVSRVKRLTAGGRGASSQAGLPD